MPPSANPTTVRSAILPLLVTLLVGVACIVHRETAVPDGKGGFVPLVIVDDAYMYARYAKNFVSGHGLLYDPLEPTDGITSPLWQGVIVAVLAVRGEIETWLPAIGSASLVLLLLVGTAFLVRRGAGWWSVLLMAAAAWNPGVGFHSSFGLETVPRTLFLVAGLVIFLEAGSALWGIALAGAFLGLGTVTRPDSGLWMLLLTGCILIDPPSDRLSRGRVAALFVASWAIVVAPTVAFRLWYFGVLLPNTYNAKVVLDLLSLELGARYVIGFAWQQAPLVAAFLAASWIVRSDRAGRTIALLAAGQAGYVLFAGGDFMPLYRFLHPLAFLFYLQVGLAVARLRVRRSPSSRLVAACAAVLLLAGSLRLYGQMVSLGLLRATVATTDRHERDVLATVLNRLPEGESVAVLAAGYLPFQLNVPVIDMLGLHSRRIATSGQVGVAPPGHRRFGTQYVLSRKPAVVCDLGISSERFSIPAAEDLKQSSTFAARYRPVELCVADGPGRWTKVSFYLRRDLRLPRGGFESNGVSCREGLRALYRGAKSAERAPIDRG